MSFALAVGDAPGTYETLDKATAAAGSHPMPLWKMCKSPEAAVQFLKLFQDAVEVVYTDGACKANGKPGAAAGVGVFWGSGDPRNVSRRVHGAPTNNVAELEAIEDAVDTIRGSPHLASAVVVIVTDSKYSIECLTIWYDGFARRGWKTTAGTPVQNLDLIRRIHDKLTPNIRMAHVRGHRDHMGNIMADKLAGAPLI
jgi:ribonuclease HI